MSNNNLHNKAIGQQDRVLTLIIEGKEFECRQQFITGAEIKKMAGISPEAELYLTVAEPWDDEPVRDDSKVDLARPEIEHFLVKKKLQLTINKKPFAWDRQFITGKQIRELGKIDADDEIYLDIKGPHQDELIADDTRVDLARPGTEYFISKETPVKVVLIVNGRQKLWEKRTISFEEVIILAFGSYNNNPNIVYTVTFDNGPHQNPDGTMTKGDFVRVKNKMVFNATATDKS
ncbi:MAG: multiubiquitin domain-containing protein [Chitinophagaceae bacterium]|nr:multiubiquitin domain-containing protein [Chitinophagaceae bacterium]